MVLAIVLMVGALHRPDLPPFEAGRFETVKECRAFAMHIAQLSPIPLRLTCEIRT